MKLRLQLICGVCDSLVKLVLHFLESTHHFIFFIESEMKLKIDTFWY